MAIRGIGSSLRTRALQPRRPRNANTGVPENSSNGPRPRIIQYVLEKYGQGKFIPTLVSPNFARYLQWFHYAEGMIMPQVNIIVVESILLPEERRNKVNLDRATKLVTRMLTAVDEGLEGEEYIAGEFSGADMMTGHACIVSARLGADISDKPNVAAYIERLNARPALKLAFRT